MAILLSILILAASPAGDHWPGFRGPTGLGYASEADLPLTWGGDGDQNVLWKAPLRGEGHASPIVWEDRVFISTVLWPAEVKDRKKTIPEHHLLSYTAKDGTLLWDTLVPPGPWMRDDFRSGPGGGYAAPTPATDGRLVYTVYGSAVIAAVDFGGRIAWRKEIVPYSFDVTIGSSPVVFGDTVILLSAMAKKEDSRIAALETKTGDLRWETKLPGTGFGHGTPIVIEVKGRPQLVFSASGMATAPQAVQAIDPATGKPIWRCEGAGDASSPAFGSGIVYVDSGRGSPGWAIDPSGEGEITSTHVRWKVAQVQEGIGSPIIVRGQVYRLHQPGVVSSWNAAGGEKVFSGRLEGISSTWASPIADPAGRIFFATAGKSFVIQAGPKLEVLATNDLGDPNHASPAVAGGKMFLAGTKRLWCVGRK